ncbi:MAG: hypothetical protein ABI113_16400 [Mucilaginibacter sp.]
MWLKILMLVIVQTLTAFLIFIIYPFFVWMFFGEGGDSFLYTGANKVVWVVLPGAFPTLLNLWRIKQSAANKNKQNLATYIIIQLILLALYTAFVVWWALNKGLR